MAAEKEFNQIEYQNEYNRKHYDRVLLTLPAGEKQKVKDRAKMLGMPVNAYIRSLIEADLEG